MAALLVHDCNGSYIEQRKLKRRQIVEEILTKVERNEELARVKRDHLASSQRGFSSGGGGSGRHQPNHRFASKDYLISWRVGCTNFMQSEADSFCQKSNMRPISIDSFAEEREFLGLVGREKQKYFWTGGKLSGGARRGDTIQWPSGRVYNDVNWSDAGSSGRPQPDNREGNELCLAVLNNFYDNEGIVFHDIACHHRKPVICEAS